MYASLFVVTFSFHNKISDNYSEVKFGRGVCGLYLAGGLHHLIRFNIYPL